MKSEIEKLVTLHVCPICGKEFPIRAWQRQGWVFQSGYTFYCSYTCFQKSKKRKQSNRFVGQARRRETERIREKACGGKKSWAKLSFDEVVKIKQELLSGTKNKDIAKAFGISESRVSAIKNGIAYADIMPELNDEIYEKGKRFKDKKGDL